MTRAANVAMTAGQTPNLSEYRDQVRAWLSANLPRKTDNPTGLVNYDTGEMRVAQPDCDLSELPSNRAVQRRIYEAGFAGITYPVEYGGQGLPPEYEALFNEEAEDFVLPNLGPLARGTFLCNVPTILAHGQPDFLRWFIPQVLAGDIAICKFFSEPSAGSDLAAVRTRATLDGNQWILNGQKTWSSFARQADWAFCLARSNWDVPKHRGLTWFVFPTSLEGVTIRQIRRSNETAEFCDDFLDDVVVPDLYRIGEIDQGWTVTQTMLVYERHAGHRPVGDHLAGPGTLAPDLVEVARRSGREDDPVVRQRVARGHMLDFVSRSLAWRIAMAGQAVGFNPGLAAYGKLFRGMYSPVRARIGVDIGGVGAMTWEPGTEGRDLSVAFIDSKITAIGAGTNEMQRNGISERILGMPREMSVDTRLPFNEVLNNQKDWTPPQF